MTFTEEIVCPPQFERVFPFEEGFAKIKSAGHYGFINEVGELVVPCEFYEASQFSNGLAAVKEAMLSKHGFIDSEGSFQIPAQFLDGSAFSEGLAVVRIDVPEKIGLQGYIDSSGNFVIEPKFQLAHRFSEGLAAVSADKSASRFGFIKIGPHFGGADLQFSEGLAAVWNKGKFGFIDCEGVMKIPYQFYNAGHFSCGLAAAKIEKDGKSGFINKNGEWQIKPQFFVATDFEDGVAFVYVGDTRQSHIRGLINTNGEFIWKWNQS